VRLAIRGIDAEIIVVDNESNIDKIQSVETKFKEVIFIKNNDNKGFAKANNQALQISKGFNVLFLNPDTIIPPNTLIECLNYFSDHNKVGAIGVQMVNKEGLFLPESKRSFPQPISAFFKLMGISKMFPNSHFFNHYAMGELDKNHVHKVEVLAGAFMMVRGSLIKELQGFDEQFFMYGEDIDLSKRITNKGFENHYLGNIIIQHFKGMSTNKNSQHFIEHFFGSMELFVAKYYTNKSQRITKYCLICAIGIAKKIAFLRRRL
jgi:GT2 family glycosyltransferase